MSNEFMEILGQDSFIDTLMGDIDAQIENAPLGYEDSKAQFVRLTQELGLQHTFSFDEAWVVASELRRRKAHRNKVKSFQEDIEQHGASYSGADIEKVNPLKHTFADGMYIREIINPANHIIVTKIHKQKHPFFLLYGEMSILTDDGVIKVAGPHYGVTEVGTKRIIYTHTECKFVTVHLTDKTELDDIEADIIAKDFSDPMLIAHNIDLLVGEVK